jgi:(R,R)-butanediol dehydrogenase / meso-butanediol dehydrogenase / diacetyl reductase
MKALRWYAKQDLRYEDMPEPVPGPGQVKINVHLAGICGTDMKEYTSGPCMIDPSKVPIVPGHEFSGKIAGVGEGVTSFKVGDRVTALGYWYCGDCYFCNRDMNNLCVNAGFTGLTAEGSLAEYVVLPAYAVFKLPDSVSDEAGALVEPLSVAIHGVRQGNVSPGDKVAIVGDGTIGLCVLLAARAAGAAEVYTISKTNNRGKIAQSLGATAVIDADTDPVSQIMDRTDGLGVDISFECVGVPETPQLALDLARFAGTTVIMGVSNKPSTFDFMNVMFGQKKITGSSIYVHEADTAIALLADKRIIADKLVTSIVPLKDAVKNAFEKLMVDMEYDIKILIKMP